ncbi:PREDICTED: THAP domain-containing protein 1 A [Trachymyrmex cornetzi]|uniref:THAP-type domain-containing protein n=1 Tax=Trachymyrmex cornetzi TaxID=471704 RepID=A0A151JQH2_9HYME|nr:PREDICTED: THAP domain-containing protein 1 A [Trachymyrmex cornetzi]KYN29442.1 hypothetical protein ALC57_01109 [Trachymyrmex cornetzi]
MPVCCIRNCKTRTGRAEESSKVYYFPKEPNLRKKWLEACKRKEEELKQTYSVVCERHFLADCIEEKWTEQRLKNQSRVIRRLKKDAVPTEYLNIETERKQRINRG